MGFRMSHPAGFAVAITGLAGVGLGCASIGFSEQLFRVLDPAPLTWRLVWGAILASLALAPLIPPAVGRRLANRTLRRRPQPPAGDVERDGSDNDAALLRTVLAAVALLAGLAVAALPLIVHVGASIYLRLLKQFVWMPGSLTVLEAGLVLGCAAIPFGLVGWVLSCVHGVADPVRRWSSAPLAWMLGGTAVAVLVIAQIEGRGIPAEVVTVIGSTPYFVVSILAAHPRPSAFVHPDLEPDGFEATPPEHSDDRPRGLRVAVLVIAAAGSAELLLWARVLAILGGLDRGGALATFALLVVAGATGFGIASRRAARRGASIGGLGLICMVAGVCVAVGLAAVGLMTAGADPDGRHARWIFAAALGCAAFPLMGIGWAAACAHTAVLSRSGSRPVAGASVLSLSVAGTLLVAALVLLPAVRAAGTFASIATVALTLVALGGVCSLHGPARGLAGGSVRLGAAIGLAVVIAWALPHSVRGWLAIARQPGDRLVEGQWITQTVGPGRPGPITRPVPSPRSPVDPRPFRPIRFDAPLLTPRDISPDRRITWIGQAPAALVAKVGAQPDTGEYHPFDPSLPDAGVSSRRRDRSRLRSSSLSGPRALRTSPGRFDVTILSLDGLSSAVRQRLLRAGTVQRAQQSLTPDGMVAVLLPLESCDARDVDTWVDQIAAVSRMRFRWHCGSVGDRALLVLVFGREGQWPERWARWSPYALRSPAELPD